MLDKNKVERFIAAAMKYEGDLYSQQKRMQNGYSDCSSIPYKALRDTGLLDSSQTQRTISTKYMRDGDPRMYRINLKDIQRGDLLWWQKPGINYYYGHTGIYLGNNKVLEAIKPRAKVSNINRLPWQRAYRIKSLESEPVKKFNTNDSAKYVLLYVNGKQTKVSPFIENNISYINVNGKKVGVRAFFEALGMVVKWNSKERRIEVE